MPIWGDEIRERSEREYRLRIERHTGEDVRQFVARRKEELERRRVAQQPKPYDPGVYEEEIHPPGEHWVTILMPDGQVGTVRFPDALWDDHVIPHLWKRFHAKTRVKIKII
jgi:hypothetical protein